MEGDDQQPTGPFEGPEKLLEIWFAPSPAHVPGAFATSDGRFGLRKVPRQVWADMLDIVKCKILSVVEGTEMAAYLLSESSLFVSPHKLILKTCGTTLNLLGLPRILEIAREHAALPSVYRCFYSRKAFMFPERQVGPHRDWKAEIDYLDQIFPNGSAYTVGKVNGDHWLLYMTTPGEASRGTTRSNTPIEPAVPPPDEEDAEPPPSSSVAEESDEPLQDYTIEILMTHLSSSACAPFMTSETAPEGETFDPSTHAMALSAQLGISDLFPPQLTTLDAYSFDPCGYSCNALLRWRQDEDEDEDEPAHTVEGYYTIHVTPEDGSSYASFECNVPLPTTPSEQAGRIPDLKTLVRRVSEIFQPGRLTLTLFISSADNETAEEEDGESAVEAAQRAFKSALTLPPPGHGACAGLYKRTDKINYEFGGYDLAFATFERRP